MIGPRGIQLLVSVESSRTVNSEDQPPVLDAEEAIEVEGYEEMEAYALDDEEDLEEESKFKPF